MKRQPGIGADRREITCEECFFRRAELCALPGNDPCPTFRPAGVHRPPQRVAVAVLRERRVGAAA